jgi:hypothetical protein
MQVRVDVTKEVLRMVKRIVPPGEQVTPKVWRIAYGIVRAQAVADTTLWKQTNITISRREL